MANTLPTDHSIHPSILSLDRANKVCDFLFYALIALSLVPVWTSPYIPTQDGPVHLANANIIRSLLLDEGGYLAGYYHLTKGSLTNWAIYILINLINLLVDIQYAEKIVISLYLILLPLSVRYALLSIDRRNLHLQFLILPMLYNVTLSYGFYNFILSLPLFFFGAGYWYKNRTEHSVGNILKLSVLLLISYLAHPLTLIFLAATIFSSSFYETLLLSQKQSWSLRTALHQLASALIPLAISILPCVALFLLFLSSEGTSSSYTTGPYARFYALTRLNTLVPYGPSGIIVSKLFSLTLAITIVAAIFHQARAALLNFFTLPLIISLVLYFIFPDEISNGSVINCRLQLFTVFSLMLFMANQSFNRAIKLFTVASCTVLFVASLWFVRQEYAKLNSIITSVMNAAEHIQTNSNVLSLSYYKNPEKSAANPLLHIASHTSWKRNAVDFSNFQATQTYFPVNYSFPSVYKDKLDDVERIPPKFDILKYSHASNQNINYVLLIGDPSKYSDDRDTQQLVTQLNSKYSLIYQNAHPIPVSLYGLASIK